MTIRFVALRSTMPSTVVQRMSSSRHLAAAEPCSVVGVLERDFATDFSHRLIIRGYSVDLTISGRSRPGKAAAEAVCRATSSASARAYANQARNSSAVGSSSYGS